MNINNITIDFLGHSGFLIKTPKKRIVIDPYNVNSNLEKADIILITHGHPDHCSIKDIQQLSKTGTIIIAHPDCQSKITRIKEITLKIININQKIRIDNIIIETIPAYNTNKPFHSKSEGWLGYIITTSNVTIYHAGDTDKIAEMSSLQKYSKHKTLIALLPVSGQFVMTAQEASEAAQIIKPTLAIPMHYGSGVAGTIEDAKLFSQLCQEKGINAKILDKI